MTTKSINLQKDFLPLPNSWKNARVFISISSDSLIMKKIKPLNLRSIKLKLKKVGKNISAKDIKLAIQSARK
ncbi:MAG: hypothetical protein PHU42_00880 [Patescibacteria group bacterium]|nr:hypothetical protein [Patescibacteria group bacterium]